MKPSDFYLSLLNDIDDVFVKRVQNVFINRGAIGKENRISRDELVYRACGNHDPSSDRKVRVAMAMMPVPPIGLSGSGGYFLPGSYDEIVSVISENNDRIKSLQERNSKYSRLRVFPWENKEPEIGQQLELIG